MSTTLATAMAALSGLELAPRTALRAMAVGRAWDAPDATAELERELALLGA